MAGIYVGLPWYWKLQFAGVKKFVSNFHARTNQVPSYYAADAYTVVWLILHVAKEIKSIESNRLKSALENRTFRSLKEDEQIRREDHVTFGQIFLGIGKGPSEIQEEGDFFRIIKVAKADCVVDRC
jgi:ABC-type branched-subunit amino acid transport system substrate-binding protein